MRIGRERVFESCRPRRALALTIVLLMALPALNLASGHARAVSSNSANLNLLWPNDSSIFNQTVGSVVQDSYTTTAVGANAWSYSPSSEPGYREVSVGIVMSANSRNAFTYDPLSAVPDNGQAYNLALGKLQQLDYNPNTPAVDPFPRDSGMWLSMSANNIFPNDNFMFCYQGAYYNMIFVASNGFIVLSSTDYYQKQDPSLWVSENPAMPSHSLPNTVIAPFWARYYHPNQIYAGYDGLKYVICWQAPDYLGIVQQFAIGLIPMHQGSNYNPIGTFKFYYGAITDSDIEISKVGMEDQFGDKCTLVTPVANSWREVVANNNAYKVIKDASILVKTQNSYDGLSWGDDSNQLAWIKGEGNSPWPGGTNLVYKDASQGAYNGDTWLSVSSWIFGTMSFYPPLAPLGIAGELIDSYLMAKELTSTPTTPTSYCGVWERWGPTLATSWTRMNALDQESQLGYAWDVRLCVYVRWLVPTSALPYVRLVIDAKDNYSSIGSGSPVEKCVEVTIGASNDANSPALGVGWEGRTIPDSHYYNFHPLALSATPVDTSPGINGNVGDGYRVDSVGSPGSADYGYQMMGWSKPASGLSNDYAVRSDGTIRVEGYFWMSDTFTSDLWGEGRRCVNIYVMPDKNSLGQPAGPTYVLKTVQVLSSTDPVSTWIFKSVLIDTGLVSGTPIKIGIGRPDFWANEWGLSVQWAGIKVYCRDISHTPAVDSWGIYTSGATGGSASPATPTYGYNAGSGLHTGVPLTITGAPNTRYRVGYWNLNGALLFGDRAGGTSGDSLKTIQITAGPDIFVSPVFVGSTQKVLMSSVAPQGVGALSPSAGINLFSAKSQIKVTATPIVGYAFSYWSLDGTAKPAQNPPNSITITMSSDFLLAGNFVPYSDVRLTSNSGASSAPAIAVDNQGNYLIAWSDNTNNNNNEIYFKMVDPSGNTLSDQRISNSAGDSISPAIAYRMGTSSYTCAVAWADNRNGNYAIYTRTYSRGTWGAETLLASIPGTNCKQPDVAIDPSNNVPNYVYHTVAVSGGVATEKVMYTGSFALNVPIFTWTGTNNIGATHDRLEHPRIAMGAAGTAHVLFSLGPQSPVEFGASMVFYIGYSGGYPNGAWRQPYMLSQDLNAAKNPSIDADQSGHVYAVWDHGYPNVYYSKSNDGGLTWSAYVRLVATAYSQCYADVAIGPSGEVLVVWQDSATGTYSIRYVRSADFGSTWGSVGILSTGTGNSCYPRACVSLSVNNPGEAGIVWQDDRNAGNWEIYFAGKYL